MGINFLNDGNFPDNAKLTFGTSGDGLEIYHDGSNSYIDETGTGSLYIKSAGAIRLQSDTGENMIYCVNDGAVNLYHNNVNVFSTASDGVIVQGSGNDITFVGDGSDYNYLKVFVPDTYANVIGLSQGKVGLFTNNTERLTIISNGSVGIGTTLPGNLLHVEGNTTLAGDVFMADNDTLRIGSKATTGDLTLYHNGTNSYIENATGDLYIDSNGDDLYLQSDDDVIIRSQGSENAVYCTGNAGVALYHNNSSKFTTTSSGVSVTGNCTLSSDGNLVLDPDSGIELNTFSAPGAGAEGNGIIIKLHSSTTVFGKIYYKSNLAAAWSYANAGSDGTTRMLGVALGTSSLSDGMLLQGLIRIAGHGLSAGAPLYVSTTNGEFTTTAPSSGGDYVRVVGYTIDSNIIYFNPSGTWVEVA